MSKTGWKRELHTSKREQGIVTPPQPRRKSCGCWFKGDDLFQYCVEHYFKYVITLEEASDPLGSKEVKVGVEKGPDVFPDTEKL